MSKLPTISIVVPTKNEEKNIDRCLESIFRQDYPKHLLEVFVCDNHSQDKTLDKARKFPVETIGVEVSDPEVSKMIVFAKAKGELFMYLDADIHLKGTNWFTKMTDPLLEDKTITASFTRYYSDEHSTPIEDFLNMDPLQRDPVLKFFSTNIEEVVAEERQNYTVCIYRKGKIPPAGLCLHRRNKIEPFLKRNKRFHELNLLAELVASGNNKFAYVPQAGLFHHHARNLGELLKKRSRNVSLNYFQDMDTRRYFWFDTTSLSGFLKIIFWVIWANLLLPELLHGIYRSFKYRTFVGLYQPVVSFLVTNTMLFSFLINKNALNIFKSKQHDS